MSAYDQQARREFTRSPILLTRAEQLMRRRIDERLVEAPATVTEIAISVNSWPVGELDRMLFWMLDAGEVVIRRERPSVRGHSGHVWTAARTKRGSA